MSWFTKYRPTSIAGLHLTTVREGLLKLKDSGNFPQTLLFAGPKGTGKTSSARIIGAMLNDPANQELVDHIFFQLAKPKQNKLAEPDVSLELARKIFTGNSYIVNEMDAASNRGIDDVRALKERINLPPQEGKIAVYILDEVHMLTTEAFNALLKVLEEPPKHVVFILATTEKHKLPATIVSRCTEISFHKASIQEIVKALSFVLDQEKINYQEEALTLIAQQADGSFRDAVKMLETISIGEKKVDLALVEKNSLASLDQQISTLVDFLLDKNEIKIVEIFQQLRNKNVQTKFFYKSLMDYLHQQLLIGLDIEEGETKYSVKVSNFLLSSFNQIEINPNSAIELLDLELKFLELIFKSKEQQTSKTDQVQKKNSPIKKVVACKTNIVEKSETVEALIEDEEEEIIEEIGEEEVVESSIHISNQGNGQRLIDHWADFLASLKYKNISLELLLRSAQPISASDNKITIQVFYTFHKEQLEQAKFLSQILDCMKPIAGGEVELFFTVAKNLDDDRTSNITPVDSDDLVDLAKQALV